MNRRGIVIAFDCSHSMKEKVDGKRKIDIAVEGLSLYFLRREGLDAEDELAAVSFPGSDSQKPVDIIFPFTPAHTFPGGIPSAHTRSTTPMSRCINYSTEMLTSIDSKMKILTLISDGQYLGENPSSTIENLKKNKITVDTIKVGFDDDKDTLRKLSQETGGDFTVVTSAKALKEALIKLGRMRSA